MLFLIVISVLVLINFIRQTAKYLAVKKETEKRVVEIEALERESLELKKLKDYSSTEFYKEKEAREKLGFMEVGEKVIILPPEKEQENLGNHLKGVKKKSFIPYFKNWWQYFFP